MLQRAWLISETLLCSRKPPSASLKPPPRLPWLVQHLRDERTPVVCWVQIRRRASTQDAISFALRWLGLLRFVCQSDLALNHAQIFFLELILVLCLRYGFLGCFDLLFELFDLVVLALTLLLAQIHSASDVFVILISFVYFGLLPLDSQL